MKHQQLELFSARAALALLAALALGACSTFAPVANAVPEPAAVSSDQSITGPDVPGGSAEDFIVNVGRRTYFAPGSAELDDTAKATLDKQLQWLEAYTKYKVKIEGFADDPGSPDANKALGMRRANAVLAYFASKGLPANRMRTKSFGNAEDRQVRKCDDIGCKAQNRRVVTVLETENGA